MEQQLQRPVHKSLARKKAPLSALPKPRVFSFSKIKEEGGRGGRRRKELTGAAQQGPSGGELDRCDGPAVVAADGLLLIVARGYLGRHDDGWLSSALLEYLVPWSATPGPFFLCAACAMAIGSGRS